MRVQHLSGMQIRFQDVIRYKTCRSYSSPAPALSTSEQPKPYKSIPGLSSLPLLGPIHHFIPIIGSIGVPENFTQMLGTFHKKFGSVVKLDGVFRRAKFVILFEPDQYDQVYRAEDATTTPLRPGFDSITIYRTKYCKDKFDGMYGLTAAQGAQWRDLRTKVNPALLKLKLVKLYAPGLEDIANEMVARLTTLDKKHIEQNFDLEMTKFSLESVALVGLGARLGCLKDELTEDHPARQLMQSAKDILNYSFKLELAPIQLWRYYETRNFKKLMNAFDTQWNVSAKYIREARKVIEQRGHEVPEEDKSVIERLLAIDEKVATTMANEMLMAGIDTVAFVTTALLYELAKNPPKQDKLREEIRARDPNKRYLRACLKEALRLRPIVTSNLRRTSKPHVVAGYEIPAGVDVVAPNEYLSRHEKYYPRPLEFIPERWLADKTDPLYYGTAHPMVYLPFGFGIRSCIGRRIAELEIETFVQKLVENYKIKWEGPPLKIKTMVMNSFKKPYYFSFEAAK